MVIQFMKHRCNAVKDLDTVVNVNWGVEIDLRASTQKEGACYLAHDAWAPGEDFEDWLVGFKQRNIQ